MVSVISCSCHSQFKGGGVHTPPPSLQREGLNKNGTQKGVAGREKEALLQAGAGAGAHTPSPEAPCSPVNRQRGQGSGFPCLGSASGMATEQDVR